MVDQDVRVDDNCDGKGDDVVDENKVNYAFEDVFQHFQIGIQKHETSYGTCQSYHRTNES